MAEKKKRQAKLFDYIQKRARDHHPIKQVCGFKSLIIQLLNTRVPD